MRRFLWCGIWLGVGLLGGGCVVVPKTVIAVDLGDGRMIRVTAPKDVELSGLVINPETREVRLESYRARMNPDVIGQSAAGQLELLKQYRGMFELGLQAASQGLTGRVINHGGTEGTEKRD